MPKSFLLFSHHLLRIHRFLWLSALMQMPNKSIIVCRPVLQMPNKPITVLWPCIAYTHHWPDIANA